MKYEVHQGIFHSDLSEGSYDTTKLHETGLHNWLNVCHCLYLWLKIRNHCVVAMNLLKRRYDYSTPTYKRQIKHATHKSKRQNEYEFACVRFCICLFNVAYTY